MKTILFYMFIQLCLQHHSHIPGNLPLHRIKPVPKLITQLQELIVPGRLQSIQAGQHISGKLLIGCIRPPCKFTVELIKLSKEHRRIQMIYYLGHHTAYTAVIPGIRYVCLRDHTLILSHFHRGKTQLIIIP